MLSVRGELALPQRLRQLLGDRDAAMLPTGAAHRDGQITLAFPLEAGSGLPDQLRVPFDERQRPLLAKHVLTLRTPMGRAMKREMRFHGGPLIRYKRADLTGVGVELLPDRTVGVTGGLPTLDGGRVLDVANVIWATGFRQDFGWIDPPVTGEDGWPLEYRGIVQSSPGLYFVGLAFQYAFASMLIGGAGRDAEFVVKHLVSARSDVTTSQDPVLGA